MIPVLSLKMAFCPDDMLSVAQAEALNALFLDGLQPKTSSPSRRFETAASCKFVRRIRTRLFILTIL